MSPGLPGALDDVRGERLLRGGELPCLGDLGEKRSEATDAGVQAVAADTRLLLPNAVSDDFGEPGPVVVANLGQHPAPGGFAQLPVCLA